MHTICGECVDVLAVHDRSDLRRSYHLSVRDAVYMQSAYELSDAQGGFSVLARPRRRADGSWMDDDGPSSLSSSADPWVGRTSTLPPAGGSTHSHLHHLLLVGRDGAPPPTYDTRQGVPGFGYASFDPFHFAVPPYMLLPLGAVVIASFCRGLGWGSSVCDCSGPCG